jgi:hypothetical protein
LPQNSAKFLTEEKTMPTRKELQHEYDTTRGLWCIDRNPAEVDYEWIKRNAFRLKDYLKAHGDEPTGEGISIGAFTLKTSKNSGKVWMGRSGQAMEVDEKVLEDLLKSFF